MPHVVVVGAGPVGLVTAVLLGRRGHRVTVLDRREQPYDLPRAVHFDDEAARVLQATGVLPDLLPLTEPAGLYEWRNAAGRTLLAFDRSQRGPSGWPEGTMFCQPDLERLLVEQLRGLPTVSLRRGAELVDLAQDDGGALLSLAGGERLSADWVVGADGAGSTVRTLAGLPLDGLPGGALPTDALPTGGLPTDALPTDDGGSADTWLVADVRLRRPRAFTPSFWQLCDPARPTTILPSGAGRRRWEFLQLPGEDLAGRAWELLAAWDLTPADAELERSALYRYAARWAPRWRDGRVLLAGDAAHQMPPFAGQGLCAGLRDAAALAWRLDLVLRGAAPGGLLDSYGTERLDHVRMLLDFSVELGKVICVTDPVAAAERDEAMTAAGLPPPGSSVLDIPLGPGLWRGGDPLAGHLGPQGVLQVDTRRGLADDLLGRVPVLLARQPAPVPVPFAELGGVVLPLSADVDVEGTYTAWLDGAGRDAAVLRPDGYVYASTAPDGGGAAELAADFARAVAAA